MESAHGYPVWQCNELFTGRRTRTPLICIEKAALQGDMPMAARAVGGACSANHLLIAATCHRVLRNDGGLGGFAVGLEPKRYLLKLENTLA